MAPAITTPRKIAGTAWRMRMSSRAATRAPVQAPVPFILLLIRRIFDWLRGTRLFGPKIAWLERRAHLKGRVVRKYRLPGLIILVAIPLPGTGAWTGALVAALLDIRMRHAVPAIFLGVVIAGAIVTVLTYGVVQLF